MTAVDNHHAGHRARIGWLLVSLLGCGGPSVECEDSSMCRDPLVCSDGRCIESCTLPCLDHEDCLWSLAASDAYCEGSCCARLSACVPVDCSPGDACQPEGMCESIASACNR